MAVEPNTNYMLVTKARRMVEQLSDMAQQDLLEAIACANLACDSTRPDWMEACFEEFMNSCLGKMRTAISLAMVSAQSSITGSCLSAQSVPESEHDRLRRRLTSVQQELPKEPVQSEV